MYVETMHTASVESHERGTATRSEAETLMYLEFPPMRTRAATRSPTLKSCTFSPIWMIDPTTSIPGVAGNAAASPTLKLIPRRIKQSEYETVEACYEILSVKKENPTNLAQPTTYRYLQDDMVPIFRAWGAFLDFDCKHFVWILGEGFVYNFFLANITATREQSRICGRGSLTGRELVVLGRSGTFRPSRRCPLSTL